MARLNEDGQWIILMGFIVSITIFLLAIIVTQSTMVGKTTADSVLEFPKTDIQDLRSELMSLKWDGLQNAEYFDNITTLSLQQKSVIVTYSADSVDHVLYIHYNNGLTIYNETYWENY